MNTLALRIVTTPAPRLRYFFLPLLVLLLGALVMPNHASANDRKPGHLVTVEWLERSIDQKNVLLLDASMAQQYAVEHIPGAVNADVFGYGGKEVSAEIAERRYQSWGISADKTIILYDRDRPMMATRLFFDLYESGFPKQNLFILDGGLTKWKAMGKPVTAEPTPHPKAGSFKIRKPNHSISAKLPEFLTATGDRQNNVILEALDAQWHYGELQMFSRPGHIPHSIFIPSDDFFREDKTFKSDEEILKILKYYGINKERTVYTYCGGGIAASVPVFALHFLLNYPNVKLFSASELGWLRDDRELPFWTYDKPYLMRDTDWIKSWGGKMMRMYGVSDMQILDVRPTAEYMNGHLPFAITIPFETLKNSMQDVDKLKDIVLRAGLNPTNEIVIVSQNGIDEKSSFAFLLLEYLGFQKISIYRDTHDHFMLSGGKLSTDTHNSPMTIGSAAVLTTQHNVMISDVDHSPGIFPKVFIASGKDFPAHTSQYKVVHVPYASLIDSTGKPKAAKEIWKSLQQAGVPRYGELVCLSEYPEEAAVNYFVLKLMGFPDVKILRNSQ